MKVYLQAMELTLTPEEMRQKIPSEKLNQLKGKGILQAYRVAHEGKSQPKILGEGHQVLRWGRAVIHRLASVIKAGTKFFVGHGSTNDHNGRREVGEVLASYSKEIGGKLSDIVIGHFPNESDVTEMDVCSIEADVATDNGYVDDVNDVSAIALGASHIDSPAFPGALRLASVQCFEEETLKSKLGDGEDMAVTITFRDVQDFIKERNVFAHQLYSEEDLRNDNQFGKVFKENENLKTKVTDLTKNVEDAKTESEKVSRQSMVSGAKERFEKLLPTDLTDKQKTFMLGRFDAEVIAEMDDAKVNEYIDNERKEFAETAKLFGVTESERSGGDRKSSDTEDEGDLSPEEAALQIVGVE